MFKLIMAIALLLGTVLIAACAGSIVRDVQSKEATVVPTAVSPVNDNKTPGETETATFALG